MGTEDRIQKRRTGRMVVRYGAERPTALGFMTNFSAGGLGVQGPKLFPVGTRLELVLDLTTRTSIPLRGEVRWVRSSVPLAARQGMGEMGVRLMERSPRYAEFVQEQIRAGNERRLHPRWVDAVEVFFDDPRDLVRQYTENISRGGLYLWTSEPVDPGATLRLRLVIPDLLDAIPVEAVVTRVEPAEESTGYRYGLGMRFVHFEDADRRQLDDYIERLRKLYQMA
jgi:type IV pilus assembly protein PilZ